MKDLSHFRVEDRSPALRRRIRLAVFLAVMTFTTVPLPAQSANKTPIGRWQSGKVYRVKLNLAGDGKKLLVRGYMGLSLFGRTQTWTRIE